MQYLGHENELYYIHLFPYIMSQYVSWMTKNNLLLFHPLIVNCTKWLKHHFYANKITLGLLKWHVFTPDFIVFNFRIKWMKVNHSHWLQIINALGIFEFLKILSYLSVIVKQK